MPSKSVPSRESQILSGQIERTGHILSTTADFVARKIFLFGDIDDGSAYRLAVALNVMDSTPGDITITMNTGGGHIESGFAIYDSIRNCNNAVTIVGFGAVMSMGAVIMQAADTRILAPRARMMIHTGCVNFDGEVDSDKMIVVGSEMNGIRERFIELYAERSGTPEKKVRELLVRETYFSAAEAQEVGFIDGILALPARPTMKTVKTRRRT